MKAKFYMEDPNMTFLLVSLSLKPMGEDDTVDMQEVIVTHSESGSVYHPVGLCGGDPLLEDWDIIGTSGACQIRTQSVGEVVIIADLSYDADNDYGLKNDSRIKSIEKISGTFYSWAKEGHPMLTFAYVVPFENISSGQLWLELPDSEPVPIVATPPIT